MLNLMYITNDPAVAKIAENAGVQRIFVDMEMLGKAERQCGLDTVKSSHTVADVKAIRGVLNKAQLLVRVNPLHAECPGYTSSKDEIDAVIEAGADIVMLPYFTTAKEVETFIKLVDGRARVMPLLETATAVEHIDEILALPGIDEIFIGLNDLSLTYGQSFLFEPLANGTVEILANKMKAVGIPFGFGGIASLGHGMLPSERIICEHYRLGSQAVILSRSFCDLNKIGDLEVVEAIFTNGVKTIRDYEELCAGRLERGDNTFFSANKRALRQVVDTIVASKQQARRGNRD